MTATKIISNAYRPSIGALIVNSKKQFLLTELATARQGECDFVKGGREEGENEEQTLRREIAEEIGTNLDYYIIEKSMWNVVYEWPRDIQERRGFIGQARVSFWVYYKNGEIQIKPEEIRAYQWINESQLPIILKESGFPEFYIKSLLLEWEIIKDKYKSLFTNND